MLQRTLPANAVLTEADILISHDVKNASGLGLDEIVGKEAVRVLFKGQEISAADLAEPALVERNQIVLLVFQHGTLSIETEGRALERGRRGDRVRVMNLSSRTTVRGSVDHLGAVRVGDMR